MNNNQLNIPLNNNQQNNQLNIPLNNNQQNNQLNIPLNNNQLNNQQNNQLNNQQNNQQNNQLNNQQNNQQNIPLNNNQVIDNNNRLNRQIMQERRFDYSINYTLDFMADILKHSDTDKEKKLANELYINNYSNNLLTPEELIDEYKVPSYRDVIFIYALNNHYRSIGGELSNEERDSAFIIPNGFHNALNFISLCYTRNTTEEQYRELAYSIFNSRFEFQQLESPQELIRIYSLHSRFTYRDVVFLYARFISMDRLLQFI